MVVMDIMEYNENKNCMHLTVKSHEFFCKLFWGEKEPLGGGGGNTPCWALCR